MPTPHLLLFFTPLSTSLQTLLPMIPSSHPPTLPPSHPPLLPTSLSLCCNKQWSCSARAPGAAPHGPPVKPSRGGFFSYQQRMANNFFNIFFDVANDNCLCCMHLFFYIANVILWCCDGPERPVGTSGRQQPIRKSGNGFFFPSW